jgi:hypothetical protein
MLLAVRQVDPAEQAFVTRAAIWLGVGGVVGGFVTAAVMVNSIAPGTPPDLRFDADYYKAVLGVLTGGTIVSAAVNVSIARRRTAWTAQAAYVVVGLAVVLALGLFGCLYGIAQPAGHAAPDWLVYVVTIAAGVMVASAIAAAIDAALDRTDPDP